MSANQDTPRGAASVSRTELIPFRSKKIRITRSGILIPGLATVLLCVWLFTLRIDFINGVLSNNAAAIVPAFYNLVYAIGSYLLFMIFWLVYAYSGSRKPFWIYAVPAAFTALILRSPVFGVLASFFREVLPGGGADANAGFPAHFVSNLFGAGLLEELLKSFPVFICAWLGILAARPRSAPNPVLESFAVRTPLDGMLVGLASGVGFIVIETFFQYVDRGVGEVLQLQTANNQMRNVPFALLSGFLLLIPRVLQSIAGHMGWAAIFGYFIGLAVVRRASWLKLLIIGYLTAAITHATWNSVGVVSRELFYVVAVISFGMFLACLLKAKQLEPLLTGGQARVSHSILVTPSHPVAAPSWPRPLQSGPPSPAGSQAWTAAPAAASSFLLLVEGARIELARGGRFDLAAYPTLCGRGAGILGEVTSHPSDPHIVGLKNLGDRTWSATSGDGSPHAVPPRRILRIDAGTRIDFGALSGQIQANA